MFLGTSRVWWLAAAVCFVLGLAFVISGAGGLPGNVGGIVLIIAAMVIFAAAPMRYGQRERQPPAPAPTPVAPPVAPTGPPPPRPDIEAGDASEV
jgi:hypothetical protein